jgi:hypothetical protein
VEEEVKSNEMLNRPTVYAGMQSKTDRMGSSEREQVYAELMNQYVDNSIDSAQGINQHYID